MAYYQVTIGVWADRFVRVEADNEEDAIEAAFGEGFEGLCYQCSLHTDLCDEEPVTDPVTGKEAIDVTEVDSLDAGWF